MNTIAELRALDSSKLVDGRNVYVSGYYAANDGGGGIFVKDSDSTATDDGGSVIETDTGTGRYLATFDGAVNVKRFGAKGDGASDDTAAFQAAVDYAQSNGLVLYVPTGTYRFALASDQITLADSDFVIVGESRNTSVLLFEEGTAGLNSGSEKYLFRGNKAREGDSDPLTSRVEFRNIKIKGTLDTALAQGGGNAIQLFNYASVRAEGCWFDNLRRMAFECLRCGKVESVNNWYTNIARDGFRVRDTPNCIASNDYYYRIGDNPIAFHTNTTYLDTYLPIREGMVVTGCTFRLCYQTSMLGGRRIIFTNNIVDLPNINSVEIAAIPSYAEGTNQVYDVNISDNIFSNLIRVASATPSYGNAHIVLQFLDARGSTATNSKVPGKYDATGGVFIFPWDHLAGDADDTDNAVPLAGGVVITNNMARRTLPNVSAVSDWGYGTAISQGTAYDPAMADANMRPYSFLQVISTACPDGFVVSGNIIEHTQASIDFAPPAVNYELRGVIAYNQFHDFTIAAVTVRDPGAAMATRLRIIGNSITGDVYRAATNSNIDGTYDALGLPIGIYLNKVTNVEIVDNSFENVCQLVAQNYSTLNVLTGSIVHTGQPAALGFNSGNKGIGTIPTGTVGILAYIIGDADPTSATYGDVSTITLRESGAMPSAGWYPFGWYVKKTQPVVEGGPGVQYSVLGWTRLITGTSHTINVDWAEVRGLTGS